MPAPWAASLVSLMPSATAISPVTQLHASGVSGLLAENDDAVSLIAVFVSMPCDTCSRSVSARPASAAATRRFFSRGASGSRSLSRFDIVRGLESAATPCSGSVTIAFRAARASAACSQGVSAIRLPPRAASPPTARDDGTQAMADDLMSMLPNAEEQFGSKHMLSCAGRALAGLRRRAEWPRQVVIRRCGSDNALTRPRAGWPTRSRRARRARRGQCRRSPCPGRPRPWS